MIIPKMVVLDWEDLTRLEKVNPRRTRLGLLPAVGSLLPVQVLCFLLQASCFLSQVHYFLIPKDVTGPSPPAQTGAGPVCHHGFLTSADCALSNRESTLLVGGFFQRFHHSDEKTANYIRD